MNSQMSSALSSDSIQMLLINQVIIQQSSQHQQHQHMAVLIGLLMMVLMERIIFAVLMLRELPLIMVKQVRQLLLEVRGIISCIAEAGQTTIIS